MSLAKSVKYYTALKPHKGISAHRRQPYSRKAAYESPVQINLRASIYNLTVRIYHYNIMLQSKRAVLSKAPSLEKVQFALITQAQVDHRIATFKLISLSFEEMTLQ
ncbi:hypothetical protein T4D_821 [Trichinella pseudospiralis]|uniref:Uncharacterized protein n=1 Tax=Trichinella pseudospiralis TaxID=6337 RepID=A0A0V1F386_TRIPS|nr:hypothetical protein T4D_821 [Trichinella pseudospiralis]